MWRASLIFICLVSSRMVYAQIDTEFWFAPPEVTSGHGDRPVYLRISTMDQPAVVAVRQPGRQNMQIAGASVPANTTVTLDLTAELTNLETVNAGIVMRTGIQITSTAPVTAYYEVGAAWNSDIFPLKGRNGLGNRFIIPSQNFYHNSPDYAPLPSSSFDIVASRNNTVVKVRPSRPLIGHLSDTLIIVKLNAGETYSFRKPTLSAFDNPGGTVVESNKPIAITIKDDSVINGGCRDILGDQLVPVEVAGTEYVVLKGFLTTPEYLFVTATEDDTEIFVQGIQNPVTVLSMGQVYRYPVTEKSTYILASKTIYVFHVTGFGCEMGMAILPSINCKGSPQIGFTRTTNEFFGLNVLVTKAGIGRFRLNKSSVLIPASAFTAVPGTNDKWYTAQLSFSTTEIPVGQASLISNDLSSFQVGIINGNATSTCRYGYFSSFSTLFIGDDLDFCEGETAILDAGPGKETYLWNTGQNSQKIEVNSPGAYWVKVEREDCVLYDTIKVAVKKGHLDLGPDLQACRGDTVRIDGKENFSWLWSDGSRNRKLETRKEGKYWLSVFDYTGCPASDTVIVSLKERPPADLGEDILKCRHEELTLDAHFADATYLWHDGLTTASRLARDEGLYAVTVSWQGCSASDTVSIENLPGPPQDAISGTPSVCPFAAEIDYSVEDIPSSSYQWFVRGGSVNATNVNRIKVDWLDASDAANVKVLVTDGAGCRSDTISYPVRINVVLQPEVPLGPDTLCLNKSQQVLYTTPPTNGSEFNWHITGGEITAGDGSPAIVVNWSRGMNKLWLEEISVTTDTVCHGTSRPLYVFVFRDSTGLTLDYVSADTAATNTVNVEWTVANEQALEGKLVTLSRRSAGASLWETHSTSVPATHSFSDAVDFTTDAVFEYQLSLTNHCEELLETTVHNNIYLSVASDSSGRIKLHWNHYFGWPGGVDHYELWRKTDSEPGYKYLVSVSAFDNTFEGDLASDAFRHQFVIRAIEKGAANESWSNVSVIEFDHPVTIHNIITANGDFYNPYFHISKIELYKNSVLVVQDRWGREVFRKINYQNDWDGGGLSSGVYFYFLDLRKDNKIYKGALTIF